MEAQGLIQGFEYTHELAWKTLKDFLEDRGVRDLYGSRDTSRAAFSAGLIEDGETWMEMIRSRNLTLRLHHRIADELDDLLLPYTIDLSILRDISDPGVSKHIERVGVALYGRRQELVDEEDSG